MAGHRPAVVVVEMAERIAKDGAGLPEEGHVGRRTLPGDRSGPRIMAGTQVLASERRRRGGDAMRGGLPERAA